VKIPLAALWRVAGARWSLWLQAAAWACCLACGIQGTLLLRESWARFDAAMPWYGVALISLLAATWSTPVTPRWGVLVRRALQAVLDRRWELLAFLGVLALTVFMRVYDFGYFPPSDGLAFEEAQTGGIGYRVLHDGFRPMDHPVAGYLAALGFELFGDSSTSLRVPFLVLGIASVVPFYLLMRELVSVPAALFAAALFGASRWLALGSRTADELFTGVFFELVAIYLLLRGLRTGRPWNFVGAGVASGILMYEYVSYRVLPPLLALFLVLIVGRRLWGHLATIPERAGEALRRFWRPALALVLAFGVAFSPMIVTSLRGEQQFGYESFERDIEAREGSALGGLLPPGWQDRLEWGLETFTRGAESVYPALSRPGDAPIDPVSAGLLVAAVVYGAVFFFRPYRLLFLAWLLGVVVGGSVVPINFHPGRLTTAVPAAFVLIGFMVDDASKLVGGLARRRGMLASRWLWLFMVPVAAAVLGLNSYGLFAVHARDSFVRAHYDDHFFATCHYLSGRQASFAHVWSERRETQPIFVPSDYVWACHEVRGRALASFTDVWDMGREGPGDALLIFVGDPPSPDAIRSVLGAAYPDLPLRAEKVEGPGERPLLHVYHLPERELSTRRGLVGTYYAGEQAEGAPLMQRLDPVQDLEWADRMPEVAGPFSVTWEGLIYMPEAGVRGVKATSGNRAQIDLDGETVFPSAQGGPLLSHLDVGWHTIEVTLAFESPEPSFGLRWVRAGGQEQAVPAQDLFPLSPLSGLRHRMLFEIGGGGRATLHGVGWPVSFTSSEAAARWAEEQLGERPLRYVGEVWDGYLVVDGEERVPLTLQVRRGRVSLTIDDETVLQAFSPDDDVERSLGEFPLSPGRHRISLRFDGGSGGLAGAQLLAGSEPATGVPLTLEPR